MECQTIKNKISDEFLDMRMTESYTTLFQKFCDLFFRVKR